MPNEGQIILPNTATPESDADEYREMHLELFGHFPPANPQDRCDHPIHAAMRREMNGGEVYIAFDPNEVVSEDSVLNAKGKARYDRVFTDTQQWQKEIEEEERAERLRESGFIIP
jgi:hypothetical protein